MLEELMGLPLVGLTAPALLGLTVLLLLTGRLIPRINYLDKATESEKWRQAFEAEREARKASDAQTAELLEVAKTTHNIIVAVFHNSELIRRGGDLSGTLSETTLARSGEGAGGRNAIS